ncbi:SDR family NAD(P)-dependent oxidoreductase [Streptomyces fagopyri]|uniref:SDR family NAD(P)-dependent oxidoreductase n=1 Tax=Streptomyces fagopyri TaxID=2662397 RepID=UPI00380EA918
MGLLEGKTALVTGSSAGIGPASATRLAAESAHVFITGRRKAELDAAVELIGLAATAVRGDIADPAIAVAFLASEQSSFITGTSLYADAGLTRSDVHNHTFGEHHHRILRRNHP